MNTAVIYKYNMLSMLRKRILMTFRNEIFVSC